MQPQKPQNPTVCKHCSKEHSNKFIRCLRCGRLRYDISVDEFWTKLLLASGMVVMFISLLMLCNSLYSDPTDSVYFAKTERMEKRALTSIILATVACLAGVFFYYRMRHKKNEEI